jgi:hypothetical protein
MLKKNLLVFPLLIVLSTNVTGQAFKGYGGYMVGLWSIDWSTINAQISEAATDFGVGKFDQTLMLNGGGGAANVYNNLFIGGMGFGGSTHINGVDTSGVNRDITVSVTLGGPIVEANFQPLGKLELILGTGLLFGQTSIRIIKDSGTNSWDNIWVSFDTQNSPNYLNTTAANRVTVINPYLSLRYPLMPWFGIDLSLGYNLTLYDPNGWEANGGPLAGKQELGLSKPFFRISLIFGG